MQRLRRTTSINKATSDKSDMTAAHQKLLCAICTTCKGQLAEAYIDPTYCESSI